MTAIITHANISLACGWSLALDVEYYTRLYPLNSIYCFVLSWINSPCCNMCGQIARNAPHRCQQTNANVSLPFSVCLRTLTVDGLFYWPHSCLSLSTHACWEVTAIILLHCHCLFARPEETDAFNLGGLVFIVSRCSGENLKVTAAVGRQTRVLLATCFCLSRRVQPLRPQTT